MKRIIVILAVLVSATACLKKGPVGTLIVNAPVNGTYEIYRVASESPLQFVSEQIGRFNEVLNLTAGNYLVLADCSNQTVIIRPDTVTHLTAHEITFTPPLPPTPEDAFSIQCNRFDKTRSRQHISNRFSLNILSGKRDLLVGMVPLSIDLGAPSNNGTSQRVNFDLSAVKVADYPNMPPSTLFFLAPVSELLAVTEPQNFGHWQFLLPGRYTVEVNGTRSDVELVAKEKREIRPAFLQVRAPEGLDMHLAVQISGNPIYVELNGHHWINLEELYPVLPGELSLRISTAAKALNFRIAEDETQKLTTRSLKINYDCSPWEWLCLGSKAVYLFEKDGTAPIAVGMTDVPLLYFEDEVWVSVEGSRDIKVHVANAGYTEFFVGKLKLVPKHFHRSGQITDLARIESGGPPIDGQTIDLELDRSSEVPLIAGSYQFTQYISMITPDGERRKSKRAFTIHPREIVEIPFQVFVTDKKWAALKTQAPGEDTEPRDKRRKISLFRSVIPLNVN